MANGTDAIELALRAVGVGAGDVVFTVSHTAGATVAAIVRIGAVPVLVDVDEAHVHDGSGAPSQRRSSTLAA